MRKSVAPEARPCLLVDDIEAAGEAALESGAEIAHRSLECRGHTR